MQVYISFAILIIIVALFGYIIKLARRLKAQRANMSDPAVIQSTQIMQSRAETTVFGMIGMLIIDYALTFPTQSASTFFFYGNRGLIIGTIIIAIAIISFIFPATARAPKPVPTDDIPA